MTFLKNNFKAMLKTIAAVLMIVTLFSSCKKDDEAVVNSGTGIEGKWVGKRGDGNETPDYDYRFSIRANGTLDATNANGGIKGSGTWTLNGNNFTAHYQFVAPLFTVYSVKATYDKATGKLTGTWGFDNDNSSEGTWYMNKQ